MSRNKEKNGELDGEINWRNHTYSLIVIFSSFSFFQPYHLSERADRRSERLKAK